MHTKGNCIFSVSKLGGPKFFLFQEENHNGKVPHSSKHQPGLFWNRLKNQSAWQNSDTPPHPHTQKCRPRCWKLLRWSNLNGILLVSLTPARCLRRWCECQSQAVGLGFQSNFRNGQRQLHVLRTILRGRLRTWRLSTRTTLGPRRRGRQSQWEVSKVGGVCPLPVRKI